ncbi:MULTISPECIES: CHAD domain-containing protein [unclassified Methanoregula]|uniref:CHAD domain-containing protein n=1 Tax=unclassified Methanoregula TaxID=2649730 RepID=UPI0025E446AB|nr:MULTISPECIES: CHAD domain-containing protein [unclassified Methanoregula]
MQKLPSLLEAFTREIPGVKDGKDIEYIHRMRVASRRLRAALPLFEPCFPEKEYRAWMRQLSKITRALGEARDTDVQIAFLQKHQKKDRSGKLRQGLRNAAVEPPESPAIRYLLAELQKKRSRIQDRVLVSLGGLEKSGITGAMQTEFSRQVLDLRAARRRPPLHGLPAIAAYRISRRLSRLLHYEPWIHHPEAVAEHHATRIAAKKLRYTMEIYGTLYRNGLRKPLVRVKKIQEMLGDIHDCDVWIDHVSQILLRERTLLRSSRSSERPDPATLASLRTFLRQREGARMQMYRRFVRFWESLSRAGLWADLLRTLDTGRRTLFLPPPRPESDGIPDAVKALAGQVPDVAEHSRHVTRLAHVLFDSLVSLHGLGSRDRSLLEVAGLLHDTGWSGGKDGHSGRGALIVFTDETLPYDLQERAIISLAIACHRGQADPDSLPFFSLLTTENRERALALAALLRVADGLDFMHSGAVRSIRCTLVSDKVFIDVEGAGDLAAEKERARLKGDLFARVFHSRPVVR